MPASVGYAPAATAFQKFPFADRDGVRDTRAATPDAPTGGNVIKVPGETSAADPAVTVSERLAQRREGSPAPVEENSPGLGLSGRGTGSSGVVTEDGSTQDPSASGEKELSEEEQKQVRELKQRDAEVRAHENAHAAAGGTHSGSPSYEFQRGPDGKSYAVGGEVAIDTSPESTPQATIRKMDTVIRAALAPADPSSQDQKVAAQARQRRIEAQVQAREQAAEELAADDGETENESVAAIDSGESIDPGSAVESAASSNAAASTGDQGLPVLPPSREPGELGGAPQGPSSPLGSAGELASSQNTALPRATPGLFGNVAGGPSGQQPVFSGDGVLVGFGETPGLPVGSGSGSSGAAGEGGSISRSTRLGGFGSGRDGSREASVDPAGDADIRFAASQAYRDRNTSDLFRAISQLGGR